MLGGATEATSSDNKQRKPRVDAIQNPYLHLCLLLHFHLHQSSWSLTEMSFSDGGVRRANRRVNQGSVFRDLTPDQHSHHTTLVPLVEQVELVGVEALAAVSGHQTCARLD